MYTTSSEPHLPMMSVSAARRTPGGTRGQNETTQGGRQVLLWRTARRRGGLTLQRTFGADRVGRRRRGQSEVLLLELLARPHHFHAFQIDVRQPPVVGGTVVPAVAARRAQFCPSQCGGCGRRGDVVGLGRLVLFEVLLEPIGTSTPTSLKFTLLESLVLLFKDQT
jgi:hypothetical protein